MLVLAELTVTTPVPVIAAVALTPISAACCAADMVTAFVPWARTSTPVAAPMFSVAPEISVPVVPMASVVVSVAFPVIVPV